MTTNYFTMVPIKEYFHLALQLSEGVDYEYII